MKNLSSIDETNEINTDVLHGGHHVAKKSTTTNLPEVLDSVNKAFHSSTELMARTREPLIVKDKVNFPCT